MKRLVMSLAIVLMSSMAINAQEYKYEARLGWFPGDWLTFFYAMGEDLDNTTTEGPVTNIGIFSGDFDFKMKPWLTVGAKVNYRNLWRDVQTLSEGNVYHSTEKVEAFSLMPTVKVTSMYYTDVIRYYATFGLGPGVYNDGYKPQYYTAFQFVPIGIAIGNKISWFFELGLGTVYMGALTGLSWRF